MCAPGHSGYCARQSKGESRFCMVQFLLALFSGCPLHARIRVISRPSLLQMRRLVSNIPIFYFHLPTDAHTAVKWLLWEGILQSFVDRASFTPMQLAVMRVVRGAKPRCGQGRAINLSTSARA